MQEENIKYSEMSYEEFITNILKFELTDWQKHLVRLFDENKNKPIQQIHTPYVPWGTPKYPSDDSKPLRIYYSGDSRPIDELTLGQEGGSIK